MADCSGYRGLSCSGSEHDELRMRLAGRLDDHMSSKSCGYAQVGLRRLITEFIADGSAKCRLGSGPLLPFGVFRGSRIAADRGEWRFVCGYRDEGGLAPASFLGS
jgi:hypothetical protein